MLFYCCFVKQNTAYEMRISDWSSDVCSSDLVAFPVVGELSFRIRVMNKEGEARPVPCRRPLRHGEVAIGVSSDEDRPPADVPRNAHRLTFLVVDESENWTSVVTRMSASVRVDLCGRC